MPQSDISADQWKLIAEKLADYVAKFCDLTSSCDCKDCPLYDCSGCVGDIKSLAIRKAKKELGYE